MVTLIDTSALKPRHPEKANRPDTGKSEDEPDENAELQKKAFGTYLRLGNAAPADEIKTLIVSSDPQGGYLAPTEMSTEFLRDLIEYSPIRSLATVRSTSSPRALVLTRSMTSLATLKSTSASKRPSRISFNASVTLDSLILL